VTKAGPFAGVTVIELGGIGPGPHAAMVLADLGADVVRVRRPGGLQIPAEDLDVLHRGKRIVDLDVKIAPGKLLDLVAKADVLLDGFRPGTCERLGTNSTPRLSPKCTSASPRSLRARLATSGPRSSRARMPASHPCSPGVKRRRTNTSGRAQRW
jgi:alpha-methylacyl-CoA racemase